MFQISELEKMQEEYRQILEEIESCHYHLGSQYCTESEKRIFTTILNRAMLEKEQVSILIDDLIDELSNFIEIQEINQLLSA